MKLYSIFIKWFFIINKKNIIEREARIILNICFLKAVLIAKNFCFIDSLKSKMRLIHEDRVVEMAIPKYPIYWKRIIESIIFIITLTNAKRMGI